MRALFFWGTVGAVAISLATSCGGSSSVCIPGQQVPCACPGGEQGAQACDTEGQGFDTCQCPGGTTSSTSTGTGGMSTSSATTSTTSGTSGTGGMGTTSATSSTTSTGGGLMCAPTWSKGFPSSNSAVISHVAVDASGEVIAAGALLGTADFGTGTLTGNGNWSSAVIARYDCTGAPLWSKVFGAALSSSDVITAMAVDGAGSIVVTGQFPDTLDFGCGPLTAQGTFDGFVAKLDQGGSCLWSKRFGGSQNADEGTGVAVDAMGNVYVTGMFYGTTNFGGGPVDSGMTSTLFALKLDPAGNYVWEKHFGHPQTDDSKVTADAAGNVLISGGSGGFLGSLDFGGGPLPNANGVYIAKLDTNGSFVWNKAFSSNGTSVRVNGTATDSAGNLILGGTYSSTLDFGSGPLPGAQGGMAGFVAKFSTAGTAVFAAGNGGNGATQVYGVAADAMNNVILTGLFDTTLTFGGPALNSAGNQDAFFVKLSPSGAFVSSKRFGDPSQQNGLGVAAGGSGAVIGGSYEGTVDFGNGPLPTASNNGGAFLARL